MFRRFVSFLVVVFFISLNFPPASADGLIAPLGEIASFADWAIDKVYWMFGRTPVGLFDEDICVGKDAGMAAHHNFVKMNTSVGGQQGIYYVCEYCGKEAGEVLEEAESEYVASLPAQTVTSDGGLIWRPTVDDVIFPFHFSSEDSVNVASLPAYSRPEHPEWNYVRFVDNSTLKFHETWILSGNSPITVGPISVRVPMIGNYERLEGPFVNGSYNTKDGQAFNLVYSYSSAFYDHPSSISFQWNGPTCASFTFDLYFPSYRITPDVPYFVSSSNDNDIYNIGTRAASITGNYGVVNSGATVEQIETQNIVNETNNTYYSPSTGEMQEFSSWSYDYSDRSYNLTTEEGDTVNVTYGDEYLTITEGSTTTNIYYITNVSSDSGNSGNSGNSGGGETPSHTHSYTSEVTTQPTCTRSGVRTFTCTCGATYTETIPANKHNWQVVQDVKNEFDAETGELLQQGYTVYQCSVCGQQYRQDDESLPPGVIGQNTDLMEVGENGQSLISSFSGMYDGYLSLVTSLFPYLPEEIRKLLYLGITSVVSLGIFKGIRR